MTSFETIRATAEAPDAPVGMSRYTSAAEQNAADTIFIEKEADESEFDNLALATLESILCDSFIEETDEAARSYFAALGVRF